jgi:hypothetical protein
MPEAFRNRHDIHARIDQLAGVGVAQVVERKIRVKVSPGPAAAFWGWQRSDSTNAGTSFTITISSSLTFGADLSATTFLMTNSGLCGIAQRLAENAVGMTNRPWRKAAFTVRATAISQLRMPFLGNRVTENVLVGHLFRSGTAAENLFIAHLDWRVRVGHWPLQTGQSQIQAISRKCVNGQFSQS